MKINCKGNCIALLLSMSMLLVPLAGCGGNTTESPSRTSSSVPEVSTAETGVFESRVIRSAYTYSAASLNGMIFQGFQDKVTELTGGAITFDTYWSSSLVDADSALDGIGTGVAELGNGLPVRTPTLTPLGGASFYFPFRPENLSTTYAVMNSLMESFPQFGAETAHYGVKLLAVVPTSGMQLCSTKPVNSYQDLKGMKVAAAGADYTVWESAGAVVVSVAGDSRYENLQRSVIDASYLDLGSIYADHHYEVAPYVTYTGLGDLATVQLWSNEDFWNGLSQAEQAVFLQAIDEAITEYINEADAYFAQAVAEMEAAGVTFHTLSNEDKAEWAGLMDNLPLQFAQTLNGLGVPGDDFVAAYLKACEDAGHTWNRDWLSE